MSDEVVPGGCSVKKKVTMCLTDEAFWWRYCDYQIV
jgi:hypothetical protein